MHRKPIVAPLAKSRNRASSARFAHDHLERRQSPRNSRVVLGSARFQLVLDSDRLPKRTFESIQCRLWSDDYSEYEKESEEQWQRKSRRSLLPARNAHSVGWRASCAQRIESADCRQSSGRTRDHVGSLKVHQGDGGRMLCPSGSANATRAANCRRRILRNDGARYPRSFCSSHSHCHAAAAWRR